MMGEAGNVTTISKEGYNLFRCGSGIDIRPSQCDVPNGIEPDDVVVAISLFFTTRNVSDHVAVLDRYNVPDG